MSFPILEEKVINYIVIHTVKGFDIIDISSVIRPRVKNFIQLAAKLLMKGELVIKFTCLMY